MEVKRFFDDDEKNENFLKYYNDPDLLDEEEPLREVHAVRLMIQDQTKDMTPEQRSDYYRKSSEEAAKQYGFVRVSDKGVVKDERGEI